MWAVVFRQGMWKVCRGWEKRKAEVGFQRKQQLGDFVYGLMCLLARRDLRLRLSKVNMFLPGDFDGALSVLTEMAYFAEERGAMSQQQGRLQGPYQEILARCEIGRVLLLMLLQPTPQRIRPQHAQILEKYSEANITGYPVEYMNKDLFLLLQSVVMVCQDHDADALKELEKELWTYLEPEQQHLLHLITLKISSKGE